MNWRPNHSPFHVDPDVEVDSEARTVVNRGLALSVLEAEGRVFKRRAQKGIGAPGVKHLTWAVGELNGVRCYAVPHEGRVHVIMTTQDLYP